MIGSLLLALALQGGLADRVAGAPDGAVRFSFATRPGVCGNGRNVISLECEDGRCGRHRISSGNYDDDDWGCPCEPGPARVALQKAMELSPQAFEFYTSRRPPWHRPEDYEHMLDGLRKAGWQG
jgi:hypothetical protein